MKNSTFTFALLFISVLFFAGCKSSSKAYGDKVKEPFSGSSYESNNRFFRAVGKGKSVKDNIARKKADVDAKGILAGQVNVTMKQLSDAYASESQTGDGMAIYEKFQDLTRQVMSTEMADLRKFDETKYFDGTNYTVFVAYEIKKNSMFKFMKKQAKTQAYENKKIQKAVEDIIEEELKKSED